MNYVRINFHGKLISPRAGQLRNRNIRAREVNLTRLERIPLERQQSMIGHIVRNLHFLGHGIPTRNGGIARVQRRIIHTLTLWSLRCLEPIAGEPVIAPTGLTLDTVRTVPTLLPIDIRARQEAGFEAVLRGLLLRLSWQVRRVQQFVNDALVLTDAIAEHAAVVTVVVDAPLHFDLLAGGVGGDWFGAPVTARLVVVDAIAGIVPAGTAATDSGGVEVGPERDGFQDGAFRTGVHAGLAC